MSKVPSSPAFVDGFYGTPRIIYTSPKSYPFARNGDLTTAMYTITYRVDPAAWTPTALGTVDPNNAGFYLIAETTPDAPVDSATATFTRTYSSIPAPQTDTANTILITRPTPGLSSYPGNLGAYIITQPDVTVASYDAYLRKAITSDSGGATSLPSGGTYTLSFGGSTTSSLAYNATASAVQTALNALSPISIRGGVSVTGSYSTGFTITFGTHFGMDLNLGSVITNQGAGQFNPISYYTFNNGYKRQWNVTTLNNPTNKITGGTYLINIGSPSIGPVAYNATIAYIRSAILAQPVVAAGTANVIVTDAGGTGSSSATWVLPAPNNHFMGGIVEFVNQAITINSSLSGGSGSVAINDTYGAVQTMSFTGSSPATRSLQVFNHGITTADAIIVRYGASTYYTVAAGNFAVPDVNTIQLTSASGTALTTGTTAEVLGKRVKQGYTSGPVAIPCDLITRYSLGALSPDAYQGDDATLLQAILSGASLINYRVGDSFRWPNENSPIRAITTTRIASSNL